MTGERAVQSSGQVGRRIAGCEGLHHVVGHVVVVLDRRRLHEIGRRAEQGPPYSPIEGQLGATDGVDDDPGRVGGVPHFEFELEVERDVAEVAPLHADIGPFAIVQPRHMVGRTDVDVVSREGAVLDLAGHRLGLRDLLGLEPVALQHVLEVHVAAHVELVGVVEGQPPVFEQAGENAMDDGGADLALDVVTHDGETGPAEPARPFGVRGDEDGNGIDETRRRRRGRPGRRTAGPVPNRPGGN